MDGLDQTKAEYYFKTLEDYQIVLNDAEDAAKNADETEFVDKMTRRMQSFGLKSYITKAQVEFLKSIAARNY